MTSLNFQNPFNYFTFNVFLASNLFKISTTNTDYKIIKKRKKKKIEENVKAITNGDY